MNCVIQECADWSVEQEGKETISLPFPYPGEEISICYNFWHLIPQSLLLPKSCGWLRRDTGDSFLIKKTMFSVLLWPGDSHLGMVWDLSGRSLAFPVNGVPLYPRPSIVSVPFHPVSLALTTCLLWTWPVNCTPLGSLLVCLRTSNTLNTALCCHHVRLWMLSSGCRLHSSICLTIYWVNIIVFQCLIVSTGNPQSVMCSSEKRSSLGVWRPKMHCCCLIFSMGLCRNTSHLALLLRTGEHLAWLSRLRDLRVSTDKFFHLTNSRVSGQSAILACDQLLHLLF